MEPECKPRRSEPAAPVRALGHPAGSPPHKQVCLAGSWEEGEPQGGSWWRNSLQGQQYCHIKSRSLRHQPADFKHQVKTSKDDEQFKEKTEEIHLWQFSAAQWQWLVETEGEVEEVDPTHGASLHLENLERNYIPPSTWRSTQTADEMETNLTTK